MSRNDQEPPSRNKPPPETGERRAALDHNTYFNKQFDARERTLGPGENLCGNVEEEMFVATVGSGVLVTMHDIELKIGAMCYVLVPPELLREFPHFDKADAKWRTLAVKPIENCIAEMKRRGAGKHRIQMRLIGGGIIPGEAVPDTGMKSYIFVREYITRKGLGVLNEDLGGSYVRRVHFFPATGRAVRMMLRRSSDFSAMQNLEKHDRR